MVYRPRIRRHCILVRPKISEGILGEVCELSECACTSCCPRAVRGFAPRVEFTQTVAHLIINLIRFKSEWLWPQVGSLPLFGAWRRKTIIVVEVPLPTNWLIMVHQNIQPFALPPVEVLHG